MVTRFSCWEDRNKITKTLYFIYDTNDAVTIMTDNPYIGFGFSALVLGIIAFQVSEFETLEELL